jgi:hypothetical protein
MSTNAPSRSRPGERAIHYEAKSLAAVDVVLAEAHRLRRREVDRLLRAAARRTRRVLVSLLAPAFGWNRRHVDPSLYRDPQANLATYVKALRADTEAAKKDVWLGHRA